MKKNLPVVIVLMILLVYFTKIWIFILCRPVSYFSISLHFYCHPRKPGGNTRKTRNTHGKRILSCLQRYLLLKKIWIFTIFKKNIFSNGYFHILGVFCCLHRHGINFSQQTRTGTGPENKIRNLNIKQNTGSTVREIMRDFTKTII